MQTGSKELIRDINFHLILEAIINEGPISRAALSKHLGLTKATVSSIVQELLDSSLVTELGSAPTEKGRKPILLSLNQQAGFSLAVDIETTGITVMSTDLLGMNCRLKQYPNKAFDDGFFSILTNVIQQSIDALPASRYGVVGICLGVHGVSRENRVVFAPYYSLDSDLAEHLEAYFHVPVYLYNEANLSVLGERAFSFDYPNMINISVHSGVGMGILINDHLYTGSDGFAGEMGHTIVEPGGRPCPCGNRGCLEQYVSERALLMELSERKGREISLDEFIALYQENDEDAIFILEMFLKYMNIGINNILNTLNPDLIVINSSFTSFLPGIAKMLEESLTSHMGRTLKILPSRLQDTAILLGGIYVVLKEFLGVENLRLRPAVLDPETRLH